MPDKIVVNNYELLRKSEFHISIMAIKHLAPILNPNNIASASEQLKQDFIDFAATNDLITFTLTGQYRLVAHNERVTVVAMVNLQGVEELFHYLRQKHAIDLPIQPTHITLYTLQPETAIGILSEQQLEDNSVLVTLPELAGLKVL
ncbi:MAG: hypothetical protein ACM3JF_01335 [Sphaerimonospora mesophila]